METQVGEMFKVPSSLPGVTVDDYVDQVVISFAWVDSTMYIVLMPVTKTGCTLGKVRSHCPISLCLPLNLT